MPQDDQPSYAYRGLIAEAWDLLRGDTSGWADRVFYRDLIMDVGEPVVDVGCGTGRLLLDYLSEGFDVDGVDNSPEMLALCREKADALRLELTVYEQQMETLELPRRYRTILVPSSSFQLLTAADAARGAMHRFRDHLEPGGALAMSFMVMWSGPPQTAEQASKWRSRESEREDGSVVRQSTRARYDSDDQVEHEETRYEVIVGGEIIETEEYTRSPSARWYTQEQSRTLYADAGFVDVQLFSGFTKDAAESSDKMWTAVGRRPDSR